MNGVDDVGVVGIGTEVLVVLRGKKKLGKKTAVNLRDAHFGPDISIRSSQRTNGRILLSRVIEDVSNLPVWGIASVKTVIARAPSTSLDPVN